MDTIRKIALEEHFLTPEFGALGAYRVLFSVDYPFESPDAAASLLDLEKR